MSTPAKRRDWLFWILLFIAVGTVVSGLVQMLVPQFVMGHVGAVVVSGASHFFGIIGMFMALFGALMMHALLDAADHPIVILWAAMQKLGAAVAVELGVAHQIFAPIACWVAGFDLVSGLLMLVYWRRVCLARHDHA